MRKYFYYAAVVALCGIVSSCNFGSSVESPKYYPVKMEKGDNWGMMTVTGEILFEDEFENEPTVVLEGVFAVQEGEGYSLYTASKKPKLVPGCEGLYAVGYMNDGLVPVVRPNERISVVDKNGETKFTLEPIKGEEIIESTIAYNDGLLLVRNQQNLCGFVDKSGKVVVAPKYSYANNYNNGYAVCREATDDEDSPIRLLLSIRKERKSSFLKKDLSQEVMSIMA